MHKYFQSRGRLYCFSPPVMLATFIFEVGAAIYVVWRYRLNKTTRLVTLILLSLGLFQLAEYNVCGGYGLSASYWSRIGFVAIGALPPLGLHLMFMLTGYKRRAFVWFGYGAMIGFDLLFLLVPAVFNNYACTGNYVIFQLDRTASVAYGTYYYLLLASALAVGAHWLISSKKRAARAGESIRALMVGYLVFLVPTGVAYAVDPSTRRGIPSIMCGFAVLFAVILVVFILPRTSSKKR